jgi:hypothetical protein
VDATPELDLLTYTDWIRDDGVSAALAFAHDGLSYDTPVWKLGLLSSDAHDHLFTETSADWGTEATIPLATTGGLVKPDLGPDPWCSMPRTPCRCRAGGHLLRCRAGVRAGTGAGRDGRRIAGIFMETHPRPDEALER